MHAAPDYSRRLQDLIDRVLEARLADEGFGLDKLPLWTGQPYDIDNLSADQAARAALVDLTVEKHPVLVTHVTAPHFYVTDERTARLNVDLAERTRLFNT